MKLEVTSLENRIKATGDEIGQELVRLGKGKEKGPAQRQTRMEGEASSHYPDRTFPKG